MIILVLKKLKKCIEKIKLLQLMELNLDTYKSYSNLKIMFSNLRNALN